MGEMREQLDNFDEREIDRVEAIIQSMTPAERADPKHPQRLPPGAHRPRLRASQVSEVNQLLERFAEAQKMMRQMRRGGGAGMPGHAGHARHGRRQEGASGSSAPPPRKGKAQVRQPGQARPAGAGRTAAAAPAPRQPRGSACRARRSALGDGARSPATRSTRPNLELPPGFEKFLGR